MDITIERSANANSDGTEKNLYFLEIAKKLKESNEELSYKVVRKGSSRVLMIYFKGEDVEND